MSIPPEENTPERNEDARETARFDATGDWWEPEGSQRALHDINPVRLDWVEACLGGAEGKRILDVGAGGGLLAEGLARRGARVLGIDTARQALQTAKLHALEAEITNVDYRCCTVEELAAEARRGELEPFDAVTCMEMLEHTPQPASVVAACAELVRDGGDACFSTLNRTLASYALAILGAEYVLGLLPKGTHRHDRFVRPAELAAWGRESGLALVALQGLGYNPFTRAAWLKRDTAVNYFAHLRKG
ncbi:bifunctional 2-polyprenyl-6-hydroxyphenol methylase/3-demethylubiquinol 3-O-methyltransferase UbiG [Halorhodospira neutriphila]|uniref:Ubiquinone biosynthesis O-methyltransferase n=1 Tax=Halorhodospira neutriphila TaxID=168379 RepID=A0ABS1E4S4_9GAMM|nr:bifunctional 2-polyprenyl-6-hydroxyphenol methylase/3-demethylubiquinol 3-O-methyltransferase UbiG [Halorhodospira neutriphila]MBK1726147.1 bifunctional 3-demethylubiquinol 3-O-methyltransferase/2-polyprenyl-6-hydroxyphenol methylase [Halorhodospira neutriphila]